MLVRHRPMISSGDRTTLSTAPLPLAVAGVFAMVGTVATMWEKRTARIATNVG
jgi:hypothetical protein